MVLKKKLGYFSKQKKMKKTLTFVIARSNMIYPSFRLPFTHFNNKVKKKSLFHTLVM